MPKTSVEARPIFETLVTGFMPHSCSFFSKKQFPRPFVRQVNNLWFTPVTLICLCPLITFKKEVLQTTKSKNCDVWVTACPPRAIYPHNVPTLNRDSNFIMDSGFLKLVKNPAPLFIIITWWPAQKVSSVNCNFLLER